MAYAVIPKDLRDIKSKPILGLTVRQLITVSACAVVGIPLYLFIQPLVGSTIAAFIMIFMIIPILAFGLYDKHGIPLEKMLKYYFRQKQKDTIRTYQSQISNNYIEKGGEFTDGLLEEKK